MTWHVKDTSKRIVIQLEVKINEATNPADDEVIEFGEWTFTLSELT